MTNGENSVFQRSFLDDWAKQQERRKQAFREWNEEIRETEVFRKGIELWKLVDGQGGSRVLHGKFTQDEVEKIKATQKDYSKHEYKGIEVGFYNETNKGDIFPFSYDVLNQSLGYKTIEYGERKVNLGEEVYWNQSFAGNLSRGQVNEAVLLDDRNPNYLVIKYRVNTNRYDRGAQTPVILELEVPASIEVDWAKEIRENPQIVSAMFWYRYGLIFDDNSDMLVPTQRIALVDARESIEAIDELFEKSSVNDVLGKDPLTMPQYYGQKIAHLFRQRMMTAKERFFTLHESLRPPSLYGEERKDDEDILRDVANALNEEIAEYRSRFREAKKKAKTGLILRARRLFKKYFGS